VDRFAIFLLPQKLVIKHTGAARYLYIFLPSIIGIIVVFIILILRNIYLKKHIINPIVEISRSAKAIMQGNYDLQVVKSEGKRLLYSEVDELMFGFELMRDEIKDKAIREEQLKRSQKELISCISHDLKTPISTITAYSEGMRDGLADSPEKQKKYAEIIAAKAEVLTKMINDLLEHSNAELNELKIDKKEIYFADYFLRAMKEIKLYTEQKGVILEYNPNVPNLLINMDEGRINQVIYNLIENSLKYMDKAEGKIFISCEYSSPNKKLSISVKDNGSGINMADIPYVFDKFYRAEKSRNLSIPGSGLGLSICKFIIEKHGGSITCQSRQSEGTVFTFTLEAEK
jgi:signal transduction histidine kinase